VDNFDQARECVLVAATSFPSFLFSMPRFLLYLKIRDTTIFKIPIWICLGWLGLKFAIKWEALCVCDCECSWKGLELDIPMFVSHSSLKVSVGVILRWTDYEVATCIGVSVKNRRCLGVGMSELVWGGKIGWCEWEHTGAFWGGCSLAT